MSDNSPQQPDVCPPPPGGFTRMPGLGALPARRVERPRSILTAVRLMWAGAALSLLSTIVSLVTAGQLRDQMRTQLESSTRPLTSDQVNIAATIGIAVGVVLGVIGVLLWVLMARANGNGKSWARTISTILGALYLLSFLSGLVQGQPPAASLAVSVLLLITDVATLILLWHRKSSTFYHAAHRPQFD